MGRNKRQDKAMKNIEEQIKLISDRAKKAIDDHGFMVFGTSEFCYTAGLSKRGLPEIIVSAPDPKMSHMLISLLVDEWCKGGYQDGRYEDLLCSKNGVDMPIAVHPVPYTASLFTEYVTQAMNFYSRFPEYVGENGVKFVQAFWPDEKGYLPFEDNYNTTFHQDDIARLTQANNKVH